MYDTLKSFPSPSKRTKKGSDNSVRYSQGMIVHPADEYEEDTMGDKPARQVLRENQLKKDQRKQKETRDKLGSIQDRISMALCKYDMSEGDEQGDFKLDRKQSEQDFDVYIVGFNESANKKSKLLDSLYNFFLLYEEDGIATSPCLEIDLESSYEVATDAMRSANESLARLSNIHTNLIDSYSTKLKDKENKRKTKKLELSFKEAQNELIALKDTLATTTSSLHEANTKAEGMKRTLDMKSTELEKNKILIEKLRKQSEGCLGVDEKKLLKERTELLAVLEKENTELKLHLAQFEFGNRKAMSEKAIKETRDNNLLQATQDLVNDLQQKMSDEREKHVEAIRLARAGVEAEIEDALQQKTEEHEEQLEKLQIRLKNQGILIDDLEKQLAEAQRPKAETPKMKPPTPPSPPAEPSPVEVVVPASLSERTTSAVSVDPTEALNKKFKELEEDYEQKRQTIEQEMKQNDEQNQTKIDKLNGELEAAKSAWEEEKWELEGKVEKFRKMVAEMEADSQEKAHRLAEKLKLEKELEVSSEESHESVRFTPAITIRPSTAVRNIMTPGPDNPVVEQVITMYDHVNDFKEKIIDILSEIQSMGVIDETETMLMRRSMEQISTLEFSKEGNIHHQIEEIQHSIAEVMHSSEKTVHKIFKKLSKERGKIENLSFMDLSESRPRSSKSRKSVQMCDRATSPLSHFSKPRQAVPDKPVTGPTRRPPAQYTAMFARNDMEHNRRSLKQALLNHKITPKQYEEAIAMMQDYATIPQRRLQQLAKHYISHARMQIMEENIEMNRPMCDDIDDVLSRLDELYLLRKTRYGEDMDMIAEEREDLAYLLTKQLDRLEHQSGIFLIKPYIAYKANTLNQKQERKQPVFINQSVPHEGREEKKEPDCGMTWSVGASTPRANTMPDWTPEVPRLLEMDCNRLTVSRNAVSQPTSGAVKTIKSFVVVRSTKSNMRPRSNATSAEFLSISSDKSGDDLSHITSDNLPPLRSSCTSGFVSSSTSRQRLAPISSPPSNINMEKVSLVK